MSYSKTNTSYSLRTIFTLRIVGPRILLMLLANNNDNSDNDNNSNNSLLGAAASLHCTAIFHKIIIVGPRIFESTFRNHCAKKLDGVLRKPNSFD